MSLDAIVPLGARVERLAEGFGFTEGPVWVRDGYLLFSDIPNNVILKWHPVTRVSEFLTNAGAEASGSPKGAQIGPNGLTLDREGCLIICEHGNRRVTRLENDGQRTILAKDFQGKRLNSPNDVAVKSDGAIYFTDPPYGLAGRDNDPAKELPFNGIYRIFGETVELLHDGLTRPNGLAFSPDEEFLYVANSDPTQKRWMRFRVSADGTLARPKVFYDATQEPAEGVPDGLKVDRTGNLYCTGPGGVWVFSADGQHLGTIECPEVPANCAWGDDGKTLYITARTSLYRIRLLVEGTRP